MNVSINRADLLKKLNLCLNAVENRATMPILSMGLLEAADGQLSISTTDLELAIKTAVKAEVKEGGALCIPAAKLADSLKNSKEETVSLKLDGTRLVLKAGKSTARFATVAVSEFPKFEASTAQAVEIDKSIIGLANLVSFAAPKKHASDFKSPLATMLRKKDGKLFVYANTEHRVCFTTLPELAFGAITLPLKLQDTMIAAMGLDTESAVTLADNPNSLACTIGSSEIICRKLAQNPPAVQDIVAKFDNPSLGSIVQFEVQTSDFLSASRAVLAFDGGFDAKQGMLKVSKLSSDGGALTVASFESNEGDVKTLVGEGIPDGVDVTVNSQYLVDFLSEIDSVTVKVGYTNNKTPLALSGDSGGYTLKCVIFPLYK